MPRIHHGLGMVWKLPPGADHKKVFAHVAVGLSAAVTHSPIWISEPEPLDPIGKNFRTKIGPGTYIPFYYREWSDDPKMKDTWKEMEKVHFPLIASVDSPLHPPKWDEELEQPNSWFRAQANFFPEGLIITVHGFHVATDLVTATIALGKWSEYTSLSYEGAISAPELSPPECYDRTVLSIGDTRAEPGDLPDATIFDVTQAEEQPEEPPTSTVFIQTTPKDQARLKKLATSSDAGKWISTADAMEAFLWRAIIRARDRASGKSGTGNCTILSGMNLRGNRTNKHIPDEYVRACTAMMPIKVDRALLHSRDSESLPQLAYHVRKSLAESNPGRYVDFVVGMWPKLKMEELIWYKDPGEMLFTDHSAAPIYMMDWGQELGQMVAFREPYIYRSPPKGEVMVMPRMPDGLSEVMITLEPAAMKLLLEDSEVRDIFTIRSIATDGETGLLLSNPRPKL